MANINLLPWRELERERKQKEFLVQLVGVLVVAVVAVLGIGQYLDTSIESQDGRNSYLERKIRLHDEQIAEIRD